MPVLQVRKETQKGKAIFPKVASLLNDGQRLNSSLCDAKLIAQFHFPFLDLHFPFLDLHLIWLHYFPQSGAHSS